MIYSFLIEFFFRYSCSFACLVCIIVCIVIFWLNESGLVLYRKDLAARLRDVVVAA